MAGVDINKFPRWALVAINTALIGIVLLMANRAIADGDKVKAVAYEAKATSSKVARDLEIVSAQVADVRAQQEQFRREYREDNQRQEDQMKEMEQRIIRAVKG